MNLIKLYHLELMYKIYQVDLIYFLKITNQIL